MDGRIRNLASYRLTDPAPKPTRRELIAATGGSLLLLGGFDALGYAVPWIAANLLAIVAAIFLYLPSVLLPRGGPDPVDYGLTLEGAPRGIAFGAAVSLVILVGFVPGHHLWTTIALDRVAAPDAGALRQPGEWLRGTPARFDDERLHVWHDGERVHVRWHTDDAWRLDVTTDGSLRLGGADAAPRDRIELSADAPRELHIAFVVRGASELVVRAEVDGASVPAEVWAIGGASRPARDRNQQGGALRIPIGHGWLGMMLLVQLLLVAIPEEFFYRGYLQRRLDEANGRRVLVRLGPIDISRSNLIASIVFACGHFVIGWAPIRLMVFFPSLLFGWMRDRTDGLAAGVTCHVACNAMVHVAAVLYLAT